MYALYSFNSFLGDRCDCHAFKAGNWTRIASLNNCRRHAASVTLSVLNEGIILVAGGNNSTQLLTSVEMFNGNSWYTEYFPDIPEPVWLHCLVKVNSSVLYFIGGFPDRKTYFYNSITNQWLAGPVSKEHSAFIKRSSCLGVCRHNCWWKLNVDGCCGRRTILWLSWIALLGRHQLRLGHRPNNAEGDDLCNDGAIPELGHRGWWRGRCRRSSPLSAFCSGWFLGGAGTDSEGEKSWTCGFSCAGRAR